MKTAATPRVMSQGTVTQTEKELDVAVDGEGMFGIQLPDGRTAYTRDGSFERNGDGLLVNSSGYQVQPGVTTIASRGSICNLGYSVFSAGCRARVATSLIEGPAISWVSRAS